MPTIEEPTDLKLKLAASVDATRTVWTVGDFIAALLARCAPSERLDSIEFVSVGSEPRGRGWQDGVDGSVGRTRRVRRGGGGVAMSCPECAGSVPYARAFDRVLDSLERRYERLHRAWDKDPSEKNTDALNLAGRIFNQAMWEYERARTGRK